MKKFLNILLLTLLFTSCSNMIEELGKVSITYKSDKGTVPKAISLDYGSSLTSKELPKLSAEGFTFGGWYNGKTQIKEGYKVQDNLVLNAKWLDCFTVTLNSEHSTHEVLQVEKGSSITLPIPDDVSGFTFDAWYLDDQFTPSKIVTSPFLVDGNKILYANWKLAKPEKATFAPGSDQQKKASDVITVTLPSSFATYHYVTSKTTQETNAETIANSQLIVKDTIPLASLVNEGNVYIDVVGVNDTELSEISHLIIPKVADEIKLIITFKDSNNPSFSEVRYIFPKAEAQYLPTPKDVGLVPPQGQRLGCWRESKAVNCDYFTKWQEIEEGQAILFTDSKDKTKSASITLTAYWAKIYPTSFKVMLGSNEIINGSTGTTVNYNDKLHIVSDKYEHFYYKFERMDKPQDAYNWDYGTDKSNYTKGSTVDLRYNSGPTYVSIIVADENDKLIYDGPFSAQVNITNPNYEEGVKKTPVIKLMNGNTEIPNDSSDKSVDYTDTLTITGCDFADYYFLINPETVDPYDIMRLGSKGNTISFNPKTKGTQTISIVARNKYNKDKISEIFNVTITVNNTDISKYEGKKPTFKVMDGNTEITNNSIDQIVNSTNPLQIVGDEFATYYYRFPQNKINDKDGMFESIGHGHAVESRTIPLEEHLGYRIISVIGVNKFDDTAPIGVFNARIKVSEPNYDKFQAAFKIDGAKLYTSGNSTPLGTDPVVISDLSNEFEWLYTMKGPKLPNEKNPFSIQYELKSGSLDEKTGMGTGKIYVWITESPDYVDTGIRTVNIKVKDKVTQYIEIINEETPSNTIYISKDPKNASPNP